MLGKHEEPGRHHQRQAHARQDRRPDLLQAQESTAQRRVSG